MFECPKCDNEENLLQIKSGYERPIKIELDNGALKATAAPWQISRRKLADGFHCALCNEPINLSPKLIAGWRLNDSPISTVSNVDLDAIMAGLKNNAHGASFYTDIREAKDGSYGSITDLKASIPGVLIKRLTSGLKVNPDKLYSHQVQALRLAFAGKNVVLQTHRQREKSLLSLTCIHSFIERR